MDNIQLLGSLWSTTKEGVVAEGVQVRGAFITVANREDLKDALRQDGLIVFDQTDRKYYKYEKPSEDTEGTWVEAESSSKLPLEVGTGDNSIVQKQGGAYGSSGSIWPNCIATGINAIAFGAENEAHGTNAFIAGGHGSKAYQFDATVFGSDNIVGDAEKQAIFDGLIALAQGETIKDKISYLKQNWASVQEQWNTEHPEQIISFSTFDDAQHVLKYSFGFAAGTSNIVKGRAGAVFGTHNTVTGENAVGFGLYNTVSGNNSIVGGSNNLNTGELALVFGKDCKNEYKYVTITGRGCIAGRDNQRVGGQFNVVDNSAVDIVGWGTSDTQRNNIYTLNQYGDARFAGGVESNGLIVHGGTFSLDEGGSIYSYGQITALQGFLSEKGSNVGIDRYGNIDALGRVTAKNGFVSPEGSNIVIDSIGNVTARGVVYASNAWISTIDEDTTGQILITKNYVNNRFVKRTEMSTDALANNVVRRDARGSAKFATPQNDSDAATKNYVDTTVKTEITKLVDSAPEALDTLGELAEALNNHEDAYDALLETVGNKVDKSELDNYTKNDYFEEVITDINKQIKDKPYAELKQLGSYVSKSNSINTIHHTKENDVGITYTTLYQVSNICPTIEELIGKTFTISGIFDDYRPTETISFVLNESDYRVVEGVTRIRNYILLVPSEAVIYGDLELQPGIYLETSTFVYDGRDATREIIDLQVEGYNFTTYTELDKYYITTLCNNIKNGEGQSSIVQKQNGSYNSSGAPYDEGTAKGPGAVSFGASNDVYGANGFATGHSNEVYQYDGAAFGGGNIVGVKEEQELWETILGWSPIENISGKIDDLTKNWTTYQNNYNETVSEDKKLSYANFGEVQHDLKFSLGFASGSSNEVYGRNAAAFGVHNVINNEANIALGYYLTASGNKNQEGKTVVGRFNKESENTLFEVGNGTSVTARSNAFEVYKDGHATIAAQGTSDDSVARKSYVDETKNEAISASVPRITSKSDFSYRVYGVGWSGKTQTSYIATSDYSVNGATDAIAKRDSNGRCKFNDPVSPIDAANKRYVDTALNNVATKEYVDQKLAEINTALEEIIKIQNSLIGGDE